jgi:poly(3-hydroxybutyrate) depolymerase
MNLRALSAPALVAVIACGAGNQGGDAPAPADDAASAPASPSPAPTNAPSSPGSPGGPLPAAVPPDAGADSAATSDASLSPADDPNAASTIASASCAAAIPSAGARALPLPVYAGACPTLAASLASTTITSSGAERSFVVVRPSTIAPGESLPVVFLWHWLGGNADAMAGKLEVQAAADARRFIGVLPAAKGDALFRWPFEATQTQGRVDEEARFFDDMLACVATALPVNKECVSSIGVSAGALWTAQLARLRSERLASMVSLSGGVGGIVRGWSTTPHRLPSLVLWGGPDDVYPSNLPIMNFQTASHDLEDALSTDGHFVLECTHNCGHAVPPFDAPAPGGGALAFDPIWRFVLDHPYWLPASRSPYAGKPLPADYPAWCGQGKGSATPRPSGFACP